MAIVRLNFNQSRCFVSAVNKSLVSGLTYIKKKSVGYAVLLLIGFMLAIFAVQSEAITFDTNESPPYWSERMEKNGMGGEIVAALSQQAELPINIHFKPLKRLIDDPANNDLGNPSFFMQNQEFSAIIPIAIYHISLFYYQPNHAEELVIRSFEDLSGYRVGILKGTLVDPTYFDKAGVIFETSYVQDSLFKKLKLGRIDFALRIELAADQSIKRLFPEETDDFKVVERFRTTQPIAMMISENQANGEAIGEQLKSSLETIIEDGRYRKILEKYYGEKIPANWFEELAKFQRLYDF